MEDNHISSAMTKKIGPYFFLDFPVFMCHHSNIAQWNYQESMQPHRDCVCLISRDFNAQLGNMIIYAGTVCKISSRSEGTVTDHLWMVRMLGQKNWK